MRLNHRLQLGLATIMVLVSMAAHADLFDPDRITVGGFGQIIGGYLNDDKATYDGYGNNISLDDESLFGVQLDYQLSDAWSVTAQVIAHSSEFRDSEVNWLYLTYQPSPDWRIKAGKLQTPFLIHSDTRDVGFAYPWLRPPDQVYDSFTFRTYNGVSVSKTLDIKGQAIQLEAIFGDVDDEYPLVDLVFNADVRQLWGLHLKAPMGNWTPRVAYLRGDLDLQVTPLLQVAEIFRQAGFFANADVVEPKGDIEYYLGGLEYNDLTYFLLSEYIGLRFSGSSIPDINSGYVSAGINISNWTYYFTLARSRVSYEVPVNEIPLGINPQLDQLSQLFVQTYESRFDDSLDTLSVGARWDITNSVAVKADVTILSGEDGIRSLFAIEDDSFDRQATLFSVGLFWIF